MTRPPLNSAFSLTEVMVAVGIFAFAALVLLGMLPALTRPAGESADLLIATGLADAITEEMTRQSVEGGWEALAAQLPIANAPPADGMKYTARRSGGEVQAMDYLAPSGSNRIPEERGYFLVEVWRFPTAPLAYASGDAVLLVYARVSWPYRVPGSGVVTPLAARQQIPLLVSLRR